MMHTLKTLREESATAPTHFIGETKTGQKVDLYLHNGIMKITVGDRMIVYTAPLGLDDSCSLDDFKNAALSNGHILDTDKAKTSSRVKDLLNTFDKKSNVWVTFTHDFYSPASKERFVKGFAYNLPVSKAYVFVNNGFATVESNRDLKKIHAYIAESQKKK